LPPRRTRRPRGRRATTTMERKKKKRTEKQSLAVVVVEVAVEVAIEKDAEFGIRRLPPSQDACERETPPLVIAMLLCALLLEKGRAWSPEKRALELRQPFQRRRKREDKQV